MKRGKKIAGYFVAIVLVLGAMVYSIVDFSRGNELSIAQVATVGNGEGTMSNGSITMEVPYSGRYIIDLKWWPEQDPGFLTGVVILDKEGQEVLAVTAQKLYMESDPMDLKKGKYTIEFEALAGRQQTEDFQREHSLQGSNYFEQYGEGTWNMEYQVRFRKDEGVVSVIVCSLGVILGLLIVRLVIRLSINNDADKARFDERQVAIQGKSFQYGFYTVMIYFVLYGLLPVAGFELSMMEPPVLVLGGVLLGAAVVVTYGVLKDGFFGVNQSALAYMIMCGIFGVVLLTISVINWKSGLIIRERVFTSAGLTVLGALFYFYFFGLLVVKRMTRSREELEE